MSQIYKLIIVTRKDLTPAYQSVQSTHSALQFAHEFPHIFKEWQKIPYLAVLSVDNEQELLKLISKLEKSNIKFSIFKEPDIGDEITSICIEPSDASRRITSSLPLMLKEYNCEKIDKNNYSLKKMEVVL